MLGIMIIDMQENFAKRLTKWESKMLEKSQNKLLKFGEDKKIPIFTLEYINEGQTIKILKEKLENKKNVYINKYNNNAFIKIPNKNGGYITKNLEYTLDIKWPENEELREIIKRNKVNSLILTGLSKGACVLATARGALKRGIQIYTSEDLTNLDSRAGHWFYENSNHYETLDKLLKEISNPNL